jgi:Sulfotransferase domain/N-terminal domain of galactosyltransferase
MPANLTFCSTCKGRAEHIKATLPRNLADNPSAKFILLDYSSPDDLLLYLLKEHHKDIRDGRLTVYSYCTPDPFHVAHAKNLAARCAILEGADILVTLDADNLTGPGFADYVAKTLTEAGIFLCPDFPRIKSLPHGPGRPQRGYAGRLAIRAQEFIKLGGYCETFNTWRGEDIDMITRLKVSGYVMRCIDNRYLEAIPHGADVRFKEWPEAQQYETGGEWKVLSSRRDTVVNYGKFGCGTVFKNFDFSTPIELKPIPTRVFGIGMHKTATSSLHAAFKILGFDSFHWNTNRKSWDIWNEMRTLGRSPTVARYYALCDNPIPIFFKELDAAYPGSKFILTLREESNWLKSVEGLFDPKINPYYDWDKQPYSHQIHESLYGRRDFDAPTMLARYRKHNEDVLDYFKNRPGSLLTMDMDFGWPYRNDGGAGWPELCGFLEKPIPREPYPRVYTQY